MSSADRLQQAADERSLYAERCPHGSAETALQTHAGRMGGLQVKSSSSDASKSQAAPARSATGRAASKKAASYREELEDRQVTMFVPGRGW